MNSQQTAAPGVTRFGVLGTGRITRRLVADLQSTDSVAVTAIASRSQERADWFASQYGIAAGVEGYAELIGRDDVDAVYLSLPPSLHAEWCLRAAAAGKSILCEKPLAISAAEAVEIDQVCRQSGVRWLDATGWLHHARSAQMLGRARDGQLGKLGHITASVSFYRPFQSGEHRLDPQLGGGCLLDLGWYTVGAILQFASQTPTRVFASCVRETGVPLRANAMLWFADDLTASFSCGYDTATRKWFEVAGSDASLICDDFTRPWADRPTRYWVHDASGQVDSHESNDRQEQRMIECLIGDQPLDHWNRLALQTQAVLDALTVSAESNEPVALDFPLSF
ncbi:Gfo/Idh/MocA family oxidoreductase [Stieleria sp. TO1_6]|uniref:Gfo/Idh/MocA family protein n=1 Tax=Stieleria tagensis TaxID=2956795 RepID=UPI00209B8260|nr:Gfo/Idh/MocA family oxidoreductase [Stieleria tagensis]MCO8120969.1 Gfo/Idh/MocA family oxidoreductase [Stieleria tagensis]